ncbi:FHA domain-containing protein [Rhodanobacter sp. AS-Z3]|uniref:FHA domain-containing protein n=1 Tax=Rhodanobacter sp. AS-Z3 TaxID=3031330 RepID=UPI002478D75E|nr:FHA domain-containing protein [Rhodanobacter sp. AS-Z3]WEN16866.1 FHA domain-containing protein [Rhodanobacter sp. AS-Z3]
MRIEFPHVAREDFRWAQALLRIGSAPDNDLVLASGQAAPEHLRIHQDRRGWVLQVVPSADRIYVNARPVREQALLRAGDVVSVGDCRLLLRADEDPVQRPPLQVSEEGRGTVALRAVAGPLSGRVWSLLGNLELGAPGGVPLELPQGDVVVLRIGWEAGQLCLEAVRPCERHPLRVNGACVDKLALQPGDQVGVAMHRFVIDGPGMRPEPELLIPESWSQPLPEESAGPSSEVWWLIVTAAVLALGIALVLLIRF